MHQPPSVFGADNLLVKIGGTVTSLASVPSWPFCANTMFIQSDNWIEMVISLMTNVAKIGENCDIEYAFSIGSEEFLP